MYVRMYVCMHAHGGNMSVLPDDVKSWKCEICARILLSKAGYVNHKSHEKDLGYANLLA